MKATKVNYKIIENENNDFSDLFIKNLLNLLKEKRVKKSTFAKRVGISEDTLYSWTSTKKRPQWIALVLNIFDFLMNDLRVNPISLFTGYVNEKYCDEILSKSLDREKRKDLLFRKSREQNFLKAEGSEYIIDLMDKKLIANCLLAIIKNEDTKTKLTFQERIDNRKKLKEDLYIAVCKSLNLTAFLLSYF